jgi:hypothetical protein
VFDPASSLVAPTQKLVAPDATAGGEFGSSIDLDEDLVIGARRSEVDAGTAYVYTSSDGTDWQFPPDGELFSTGFAAGTTPGPVSVFAFQVPEGCGAEQIVLGLPAVQPGDGETYGEVAVFSSEEDSFVQTATIFDPDQAGLGAGSASDDFGSSFGSNSGQLYIGAPGYTNPSQESGTVGGIVDVFGGESICP